MDPVRQRLSGACEWAVQTGRRSALGACFPRLGSVCRIHTCSYRSIRQFHSALQEIQTFAGGCLAGITAKLTVRSEEATYFDRKEKMKKSSSIWALGPEVEGDDMRKLIANRIENARQQSCPNERTELPSLHEDEYDRQYARTIADHGNSP